MLRQHINGQAALAYWENQQKLTPPVLWQVDWPSFRRALHEVPNSKRRWVSKQVSNHFAHGKNMVKWKQRSTAECPQCSMAMEDKIHIICCPHTEAALLWTSALSSLKKWLKETDTDPTIIQALTTGLQLWYQGAAPQTGSPALIQQSLLGWDGIMDGWLGIEWRLQQEAYWNQWKRQKSSKCWTSKLIKKLWNIAWDMWDHRNGILHHAD